MELVLASGSKYRRQQLEQAGYQFSSVPADIVESMRAKESPRELALRLAQEKASNIASSFPNAVVIGSDQVGVFQNRVLTKPGSRDRALASLLSYAGNFVTFETAVAIQDPKGSVLCDCISTAVKFRQFSESEAEGYLDLDEPYDCVGAIKSEKGGGLLFEWVRSDDPSALIGLPIIRTAQFLRHFGINPLD